MLWLCFETSRTHLGTPLDPMHGGGRPGPVLVCDTPQPPPPPPGFER